MTECQSSADTGEQGWRRTCLTEFKCFIEILDGLIKPLRIWSENKVRGK